MCVFVTLFEILFLPVVMDFFVNVTIYIYIVTLFEILFLPVVMGFFRQCNFVTCNFRYIYIYKGKKFFIKIFPVYILYISP